MDLSIVVLAAGQGSRMKSALPKVLHPLGGKPLLSHVILSAKTLNPSQILIIYGFGGQALPQAFKDNSLTFIEQARQLGTGDAVAKALPALNPKNRVLILYGDVPLITSKTLMELLTSTPKDAIGIITAKVQDPTGLGRIVRDTTGKIKEIIEERDATDDIRQIREINTGIYLIPVPYLQRFIPQLKNHNDQEEYYLTDVIAMAVKENIPITSTMPLREQEILGINDRAQLAALERYYQRQNAQKLLEEGVTLLDPNRFDLRGSLIAENDVTIDVNVVFEGEIRLGQGSSIGPNCTLINTEIGEGAKILANSHIENAIIGKHCVVGPFARVRPGTVLSENAHVGTFVEIKNSMIGQGSKINHLSYIGDTTMGKNVNVGAGTITCNYDGAAKHPTIIEDDVFIGSDTQLIAPVRVGKGATLGAGSTVNKDVPSNQLTLTHELRQRSKDWVRPEKKSQE